MSKREIGVLACRVFALYAAFWAVTRLEATGFGLVAVVVDAEPDALMRILLVPVALLPFLLLFALAALAWRKAHWLATRMLPDDDQAEVVPQITAEQAQTLAFCVLGMWLLANGIPGLVRWTVQTYLDAKAKEPLWFDSPFMIAQIASRLVQCGLGLALLLGARGLTSLVRTFRTAGIRPQDSDRG